MGRSWINQRIGSKADAVRHFVNSALSAGWNKKSARDFAVRDWKARRGNLRGRTHPSDTMDWHVWRGITEKRLARRLARAMAR